MDGWTERREGFTADDAAGLIQDSIILIKFGVREHLEALRRGGLLYLNPQSYFAKGEAGPERADGREAANRLHQPRDIHHTMKLMSRGAGRYVGFLREAWTRRIEEPTATRRKVVR